MPERPTFPHDDGVRAEVPVGFAVATWVCTWVLGQVLAAAVVATSGKDTLAEAGPAWLLAVAASTWVPMVAGMVWVARRVAGASGIAAPSGAPPPLPLGAPVRASWDLRGLVEGYGLSFTWRDLWGVPVGVGTQLLLVPVVYLPLRAIWPDTFRQDDVEQRARELADSAQGLGVVLLVLAVVVGAPLVEELVYRGLLQGAFVRRLGRWPGTALVAVWFGVVHFQPIETPGLVVVGLVLGVCALRTGRLGTSIVAHLAFNLTGLLLVSSV